MTDSSVLAAVLSLVNGVLHDHLFPRLTIYDVLRLEQLNTAFRDCLTTATDSVWRIAAANTLPPSHRLVRLTKGDMQTTLTPAH